MKSCILAALLSIAVAQGMRAEADADARPSRLVTLKTVEGKKEFTATKLALAKD